MTNTPDPPSEGATPNPPSSARGESPLGVKSMLLGSITWVVLLGICVFGGFAIAILSDNRSIAGPLAGLVLLIFFGSAIPFGFGTSYGIRAASREPKLMAFLGGGINGCGLLTILFVLVAIVIESLSS
ncbi:MAG: hypothetical protein AAF604_03185 [Acidobacteriota bacterium]